VIYMSFQARMNDAKEAMRELASEISAQYPSRPTEDEWEDIKEEVWEEAKEQSHVAEPKLKYHGDGGMLHEDRQMMRQELKNEFHKEWKKLRQKTEK